MDWWMKKEKTKEKKKENENENEKRALLCRKRGAMLLEDIIKCCDGKSNPIKFFSVDVILKSTYNFRESNSVSEYRFLYFNWEWYSDNNRGIFIKSMKNNLDSNFCRDVAISSMVSGHNNFMKLAGCCFELEYPLLVYCSEKKYSLIDLEKIVSWQRRMKIAEDIATALAYLHTAFSTPFVYRNMSFKNILIEEDGVAKLIDFSGCISIPLGETFVTVNTIMRTSVYSDDEYMARRIVSEKTDAYGFGILMLLLLIGGGQRFCLLAGIDWMDPRFVSKFIEEDRIVDDIVDPKMLGYG